MTAHIEWIQTTTTLNQLLETLAQTQLATPFIALDTEFVRRSTFFAKPCLLQLAWLPKTKSSSVPAPLIQVALIDLLDIPAKSLRQFMNLLYSHSNAKNWTLAMHAPSEDLQIFDDLEIPRNFNRLFDTQLAAAYLGYQPQMSLAHLAQARLGATAVNSLAQSNWEQRPLAWTQLAYAAEDVILICQLCESMSAELQTKGYLNQLLDDSNCLYRRLPQLEAKKTYSETQQILAKLRPPLQARFAHLLEWREAVVRFLNVPRKWHLTNDAIKVICQMGNEEAPPKLPTIIQKLYECSDRKPQLVLHERSKTLFLQSLEIDEFHQVFYDAWQVLPPYPAHKVPIVLSKQAKKPLAALSNLAQDVASARQLPSQAFMKRAWLKHLLIYYAEQKNGRETSPPCIMQGFRADFFSEAYALLDDYWPFSQ